MAIYGYCRASTSKQVSSPAIQKDAIRAYCTKESLDLREQWFVDSAVSGKMPVGERPAGKLMLAALKRGDHVVVAKLDRFARSFVNFGRIVETFEKQGVVLHVVDTNSRMDPKDHIGRMVMGMLATFAEFERAVISIRVQEGLAAYLAEGGTTSVAPYGYRKKKIWSVRLNKWIASIEPDPDEQRVVQKVLEMRITGRSYHGIASYLNHKARIRTRRGLWWSAPTVHSLVARAYKALAEKEGREELYESLRPSFDKDEEMTMLDYNDILESDEAENLEDQEEREVVGG